MATQEFHPVVLAADTVNKQESGFASVGSALSEGLPAAVASGLLSIWNSFRPEADEVNISRTLHGIDASIGEYYDEHKEAVDMVGFVGTSLIPGMGGVKALQMATRGNAMGSVGRALGLASTKKAEYLEKAMIELGKSGGTLPALTSANRLKGLGWETADQAIQGLAFESAVLLTMHDSPIFDNSTYKDFAWNMGLGTVLAGAIGGPLATIGARGLLKSVQSDIEAAKRSADVVWDAKSMGLLPGTSTLLFAESVAKLPDSFVDLKTSYQYAGATRNIVLEGTAKMLQGTKEAAVFAGEQKLALAFNELAGGNATLGQSYFGLIKEGLSAARAAGKSPDEQITLIHGYLNNLESIAPANLDQVAIDAKKFYVTLEPTGMLDAFSPTRIPKVTGKTAYQLAPTASMESLKVRSLESTGFDSLRAAWKSGLDVDALILPSGRFAINPKSEQISKIATQHNKVSMWVNVRTAEVSPEAVLHFADIVSPGALYNTIDAIGVGTRRYPQAAQAVTDFAVSSIVGSARWAWVSKFGAAGSNATVSDLLKVTGGMVDSSDLPLLARVLELQPEVASSTMAKFTIKHEGDTFTIEEFKDIGGSLQAQKYAVLERELAKGEHYSLSHIAAHLNTTEDFITEAIQRKFRPPGTGEQLLPDSTTALALAPKTVRATWNFADVTRSSGFDPLELYAQNFGPAFQAAKELSRFYNLEIQRQAGTTAASAALGEFAKNFPDAPKNLSASTSQAGAGAAVFGASNADYGNASKLYVQETGKQVANTTQQLREREMLTLAPMITALTANPAAGAELAVLTNALRKSQYRYLPDPKGVPRLLSTELVEKAVKMGAAEFDDILDTLEQRGLVGHVLPVENPEVLTFWKAHAKLNDVRQEKFIALHNAAGLATPGHTTGVIYVPPVNTVKYPYHAFVRTKEQMGVASDITMVTAKDEASLRTLIAEIDTTKYAVHYKKDSELYHKAKGDYDYQMTVHESAINQDLARTGKLADFFPATTAQSALSDYLEFHSKQTDRLVRTAVQVKDRQFFGELQFLSDNYRKVSESTASGFTEMLKKKIADPFGDYIKTALDISKQQEFPLLDRLNEFIDKIGLAAGDKFHAAHEAAALKRKIADPNTGELVDPWVYADRISKEAGLGMPYGSDTSNPLIASYMEANKNFPRNVIREGFQKANMLLANFTLRLDFANSLLNIISTSILTGTELQSIRSAIGKDSKLAGALLDLRTVKVPGQSVAVPGNVKLLGNAVNNFFGPQKQELLTRYTDIGAIKTVLSTYHDMLDDISFNSALNPVGLTDKINKAADKMAVYTGNEFSEQFSRFVTADVMRQLTMPLVTAGRLTEKAQNAYINVFVNRVQGNYVTSQRPVVFQGTTGAAVSLFQTYAFNVLQQLYRHVEARDAKTLAVFAGLQSTIFGMNGLPFFDAVNTHIIGSRVSGNTYHGDAYSVLPAFNKELGDWLLYGTASAFPIFSGSSPALYTRGDINPRHITVLPVMPQDVPAVQASIKLVGTILDTGKNIAKGVDVSDALLNGLEHQGISRPLAGFAQLLAGRSTTSQGALISASTDLAITNRFAAVADRVLSFEGVSRLAGARPMDEAVALNNLYRNKGYDALDKARVESLGKVVKTALRSGEAPTEDQLVDFAASYAAAGGRQEHFSAAMQRWQRDATTSVINRTAENLNKNSSRRMQELLGGYRAPDELPPTESELPQ